MMDALEIEPKGSQVNTDSFCAIAEPQPWASTDAATTIEPAKEHNAVGKRICHWQGHNLGNPKPNG